MKDDGTVVKEETTVTEGTDGSVTKVEFFAGPGANSGVYMRCLDGSKITDKTCYEANVYDNRPDQSGRTGGIPNYAPPIAIVNAEGKWNTYEITMRGDHIVVVLNGTKTVDARPTTTSPVPDPASSSTASGPWRACTNIGWLAALWLMT